MEIIEEYINQGITAEICFSQKFAETTKKYFACIHDGVNSDKGGFFYSASGVI